MRESRGDQWLKTIIIGTTTTTTKKTDYQTLGWFVTQLTKLTQDPRIWIRILRVE